MTAALGTNRRSSVTRPDSRPGILQQQLGTADRLSTPTALVHLAPSPRILAYLVRKGRIPAPTMALTTVEHQPFAVEEPEAFVPPPPVITTPCDPWPRPYHLENGLRRVQPYHFTYNTYCKERWRGREILDIFASEFRDRPVEYYVSAHALSLSGAKPRLMLSPNSRVVERRHRERQRGPEREEDTLCTHPCQER